jgi:hypothetical protein
MNKERTRKNWGYIALTSMRSSPNQSTLPFNALNTVGGMIDENLRGSPLDGKACEYSHLRFIGIVSLQDELVSSKIILKLKKHASAIARVEQKVEVQNVEFSLQPLIEMIEHGVASKIGATTIRISVCRRPTHSGSDDGMGMPFGR